MFCKSCGTKLSDGDSFCLSCGAKVDADPGKVTTGTGSGQANQFTQQSVPNTGYQTTNSVGLSKNVIRFICANAVLIITYFLGWLKFSGYVGDAREVMDYLNIDNLKSLSPNQVFKLFTIAKRIDDMPGAVNIFYLLIVFPILAGMAILFALLKKNGLAKLCAILSGIITLLASAGAFLLTLTGEIGIKFGVFVAIIAAIYTFIATGGLKLE